MPNVACAHLRTYLVDPVKVRSAAANVKQVNGRRPAHFRVGAGSPIISFVVAATAPSVMRSPQTTGAHVTSRKRRRVVRSMGRLVALLVPRYALLLTVLHFAVIGTASAQRNRGSTATVAPAWYDSVRYGSGPSVGPPPSDYTGDKPPAKWCLQATGRASGDFGGPWTETSRGWLRQVLSDTTDLGDGWRKVLGGAPRDESHSKSLACPRPR